VDYRKATTEDSDKLCELVNLYCNEINLLSNFESITRTVKSQLSHTVAYVAEVDDTLVGVISFVILPNPFNYHEKIGRKINAYVLPEYRKQGVGSALLDLAEDHCKSEGVSKFYYTGNIAPKDYSVHEIDYVKEL
jgi:GNAT superfamily N-acetyltransferase